MEGAVVLSRREVDRRRQPGERHATGMGALYLAGNLGQCSLVKRAGDHGRRMPNQNIQEPNMQYLQPMLSWLPQDLKSTPSGVAGTQQFV